MVMVAEYSFHAVLESLEANQVDEAFALCGEGIEASEDPQRWFMFGHIQRMRLNKQGSVDAFARCYALLPEWIDAVFEYACSLQDVGRHVDALPLLEQVASQASALAIVCQKYAYSLKAVGRFEEALSMYEAALEIDSEAADVWSDLGATYLAWGRPIAAVEAFRMAVRLEPSHAGLWYNLASAALHRDDLSLALDAFQQALELAPNHVDAHLNLGVTYRKMGELERCIDCFRRALLLRPGDVSARWNLATALLMKGEVREGWSLYESRRELPNFSMCSYPMKAWSGSIAVDKTLLVHAEQGFGDTFQFVRFVSAARERVGRLVLAVQPPLKPFFSALAIADEVIAHHEEVDGIDMQVPLLSLPYVLGMWDQTVGESCPYLSSTEPLISRWREQLSELKGFRIGIGWQGNPSYKDDHHRSVPLRQFTSIMRRPDVSVISLQKFHGLEQLEYLDTEVRITELGSRLDNDTGAFMDTAAVLANLDLVITSDTALAHLAGAVGVPVWVVLGHVPDWRWGLHHDRLSWYPTMRLFRQDAPGDWESAFEAINKSLSEIIG